MKNKKRQKNNYKSSRKLDCRIKNSKDCFGFSLNSRKCLPRYDCYYDNIDSHYSSKHLIPSSTAHNRYRPSSFRHKTNALSAKKKVVQDEVDMPTSTRPYPSAKDHTVDTQLCRSPIKLSFSIKDFHYWLESIEEDIYTSQSQQIGWEPKRIKELLKNNKHTSTMLCEKTVTLDDIMIAAETFLHGHDKKISEFCLMWASWMLEQRYYNLILYTTDMECILERRTEIIEKGSDRISHPFDGVWNDHGEEMQPTVETVDGDYDIFCSI